jgi:hypothetical protein
MSPVSDLWSQLAPAVPHGSSPPMAAPSPPTSRMKAPDRSSRSPVAAALSLADARALVRRSAFAYLFFVVAVGIALLWWAAASGDVARAAPFVVPLVVGELLAALLQQIDRPRAATFASLLGAGATTVALTFLWDAALGVSAWALFAGGAGALWVLACARIADEAVAWRRAPREVLAAALDRVTFVPAAAVLALLGRNEGEDAA